MVIQHNLLSLNASRHFGLHDQNLMKTGEKLGSGYRINRGADDAAGLAISEKMRRQIRGLTQASINCMDGISLVQAADGAMNEVHEMLHRGTELAIQAANDTLTSNDRGVIQSEIDQLLDEIDQIQDSTSFNESKVFRRAEDDPMTDRDNPKRDTVIIQAGSEKGQTIEIELPVLDSFALGLEDVDVTSGHEAAGNCIDIFKRAAEYVSGERSRMGAYQNRLEHTINNLENVVENTTAAESRIRDADMAKELVKYSTTNILVQAGFAAIAQANQTNAGVMKLLA